MTADPFAPPGSAAAEPLGTPDPFGTPQSGGYGAPPAGSRPAWTRSLRRDAVAAAVTVAALTLLGAPLGLLWQAVSPRVTFVLRDGGTYLTDPETKGFIAADGRFVLLTFVVGAVCGLVAFRLAARRGPALVLALAAGGLLAAYVAARTGSLVGRDQLAAVLTGQQTSGPVEATVRLRSTSALMVWPAASLLAFVLAALRRQDSLDEHPAGPGRPPGSLS